MDAIRKHKTTLAITGIAVVFLIALLSYAPIPLAAISFYQKNISRYIHARCVFQPTCSEYTRQAIVKYGGIKGSLMGLARIIRCNPFYHGNPVDPVS